VAGGARVEFEGRLAAWMDARGLGSGPIVEARRLGGGTQNVLHFFRRAERAYVLRRPPETARPEANDTIRREARVLAALGGTDVPHPGLIAACDDPSVVGAAFILMEPVEGFNPTAGLHELHANDPKVRERMGLALAEAAARIGAVDHVAAGLGDFGRLDGFLERQVSRWAAQLERYGALDGWPGPGSLEGVTDVARWLEDRRPKSFQPGLMHGDFHSANAMFHLDSGEIAAVVDWELATIGAPLLDLGWLHATWPEPGRGEAPVPLNPSDGWASADQITAAYASASPLDLSDLGWWKVMAGYKLAILLEGGFARACAGLAPRDVGDRLHARSRLVLDRALNGLAL
jgi:aminoglycoside phosphotransferase (APT) family kinase protein